MNEITIDIDNYLTEVEKRQIAREEFRSACARRTQEDFERILSNAAYSLVQKEVDAAFDGNMVDTVRDKAIKVINELNNFNVFRAPNSWDTEPSKGWTYLQEAIESAKPAISQRVLAIVAALESGELRERINDLIGDVIVNKLTSQ